MKKIKRYLCVALAVMMLFLTGCGAELYELTEEEEALIIHGAAYYVAKHNVKQKDGVNGYLLPDSFDEEEDESQTESSNDGTGSSGDTDVPKPPQELLALAELIGHKNDLKITYEGSYVSNSYKEGSAYFVEAEKGKTFYVMKIKLTNITGEGVAVDNVSRSPKVKLVCDAVKVNSEITFLNSDFSTYLGTIGAGKSVETILLFEVSESVAEKIKAPALQITVGKSTKTIKL